MNIKVARKKAQQFAALKEQKAKIDKEMKELKQELELWGAENKTMLEDDKIVLDKESNHRLQVSTTTEVATKGAFDAIKFHQQWPWMCRLTISKAAAKKAVEDPGTKRLLDQQGVKVREVKVIKLEV